MASNEGFIEVKRGRNKAHPRPHPSQAEQPAQPVSAVGSGRKVQWTSLSPEVVALFFNPVLKGNLTRNKLNALRITCKAWSAALHFVDFDCLPLNKNTYPFISSLFRRGTILRALALNLAEVRLTLLPN